MKQREAMVTALTHIIENIDLYVIPTRNGSNSITVTIDENGEVAIKTGAIDRPFKPIDKWEKAK